MKHVSILMFAAATAIVLWPAGGWAQSEAQASFTPIIDQKLDARSAPAKVTTEDGSALSGKGYVEIGEISASHPGGKADAEVTNLLQTAILKKASEVGGDVVHFYKEGVLEITEVPTGKTVTQKNCTRSISVAVPNARSCISTSAGPNCSPQTYSQQQICKEWGEPTVIPITKKEKGLVSDGTVYRYDPKLTAEIMHAPKVYRLFKAAQYDDLGAVKALLDDDPHLVDSRDEYDCTPLSKEALFCNKDMGELLLAHGADVNAKNRLGETPLLEAAGCTAVVELLLAHGADVNIKDNDGQTPLLAAAARGAMETVKLLLAHGADVNASDRYGRTPLDRASTSKYKDVVKLLRQHGGHE